MRNEIKFADLRRLLLEIGFREIVGAEQVVFSHGASDTLFVFRPYRPGDPVTSFNLIEVRNTLDSRGLLAADQFEDQFKKAPA